MDSHLGSNDIKKPGSSPGYSPLRSFYALPSITAFCFALMKAGVNLSISLYQNACILIEKQGRGSQITL
jgi:hypothetical protein